MKKNNFLIITFVLLSLLLTVFFTNCAAQKSQSDTVVALTCLQKLGTNTEWSGETEITITGYTGNAMEPKISYDQVVLFFNNKTSTDTEMDVHYALKTATNTYQYKGTLTGTVNGSYLDGVPAVDVNGNFYFVSLRTYASNLQTVFSGTAQVIAGPALQINSVAAADAAVSLQQAGKLDMDIDVSWDGNLMIASNADFTSGQGYPDTSKLALYNVNTTSRTATPKADSSALLANVNISECRVYAGNLSSNLLELYYTVFPSGSSFAGSDFKMVVAKRNSTSEAFGTGQIIQGITGEFVEGASISYDESSKTLFYHKKDPISGNFKIYKVTRP